MQHHTALDEVVEQDDALAAAVEAAHQYADERLAEPVAEGGERVPQLGAVDVARAVAVEAAEAALPVGDVLPERGELVEVDLAGRVAVEHACRNAGRSFETAVMSTRE